MCAGREFEPEGLELLSAKRAAERELAVRTLMCWQESGSETDYRGVFRQALEKEKNAKVRELLQIFPSQNIPDNLQILPVSRGELVKELHGGGAARGGGAPPGA